MVVGSGAVGKWAVGALPSAGSSAVNYTLTCAAGAYVYTGQAATLAVTRNYVLTCAAGAYSYTGQAATLSYVDGSAQTSLTLSGAGYPVYIRKKRKKVIRRSVDQMLSMAMEEIYTELTSLEVKKQDPELRKDAAEIVKPFAATRNNVPQPSKIDWEALSQNASMVSALLDMWQEQIALQKEEDEEEELFMMFH